MWQQLDLLGLLSRQPVKSNPIQPSYSITHSPQKGYKVVLAPGLTSKPPKNPCFDCPLQGADKSTYSCIRKERQDYLNQIGVPDLVAVNTEDGPYGLGC